MLKDYRSTTITLTSTYGHMPLGYMIVHHRVAVIAHVVLVEEWPLPHLWELAITVSQEPLVLMLVMCITSKTHCGMDQAVLLAGAVTTLPNA